MGSFRIASTWGVTLVVESDEDSTLMSFAGGDAVELTPHEVDELRRRLKPLGAEAQRRQEVQEAVNERRQAFRAGLKRAAPPKSTYRPAVPDRTKDAIKARSEGRCEMALPGCFGRGSAPCHRLTKKNGGRFGEAAIMQSLPSAVLWGCGNCHDLTTSPVDPDLSEYRRLGILLMEHQDPAAERVWIPALGWRWLTETGEYTDEPSGEVA